MIAGVPLTTQFEPVTTAPLSSGQRRLWFLHQLDPASTAYNSIHQVRFGGSIDPAGLRDSLEVVVRRHAILRTCFRAVGDDVQQIIYQPFDVDVPIVDARRLWSSRQAGKLHAAVAELSAGLFDLTQVPLFRTVLVRLAPEHDVLLIQLHHIVADGESSRIFLSELAAAYRDFQRGQRDTLSEPPLQYADYAAWQQHWLHTDAAARQVRYWREQLKDAPPRLELPTDELVAHDYPTGTTSFEIPAALRSQLKTVAQREGVTLFMLLLAGFQALLYRYTGQQDIVIGSPIAARGHREFQHLIGCFVNTLPLRTRLAGETTFRELLRDVRTICLQAYANQELPFDRIVEELQPERMLDTTPLFRVMLTMHQVPTNDSAWSFSDLVANNQQPQFDLTLTFVEHGSQLTGRLTYKASMFHPRRMEHMVCHYERYLMSATGAGLDAPIAAIEFLNDGEKRQLLEEWNATGAAYARDLRLHTLFERQAARTPDAVALACDGRELTYAALDGKADRVARVLGSRGVGPEARVGVFLTRSPDLVAAILGVLKAGGAYVPLDPEYPAERVSFVLNDADIRVVIADTVTMPLVRSLSGNAIDTLLIDAEPSWNEPVVHDAADVADTRAADPQNLAYVIYTSGSTGVPKGVAITHGNAVNFVCWALETFAPADLAMVAATTSVCFDLSIFEIFAPLSCGGTVLLLQDALQIPREPRARTATLLNTVPSAAQALLHENALPVARVLNLAGEPFTATLLDGIRATGFGGRIFNLYGPSETTTYSTYAPSDETCGRAVPIGTAVANTQVYVLDSHGQPVPIRVAGELYIGGAGVARGYLNRPALTAERFVPDPLGGDAGARLYRTGDLVRYRVDGQLEFLGRVDNQVKIRGYRIELGEIEAALQRHQAVREAVVIAADRGEDKQLVAYVVGQTVTSGELRDYLWRLLPAHMVPSLVVVLDRFPLTPNGKVDRKRLPTADLTAVETERTFVTPRTATEEAVAAIWTELLGVPRISVLDSFFDVGGHSLLAARAVMRMREALHVELPLRALFERPTIAAISAVVEEAGPPTADAVPVAGLARVAAAVDSAQAGHYVLPASLGQQRLSFLHELSDASSAAYHVCGGLRIEGSLRRDVLEAALQQVVARHESLRTGLAVVDGELRQIVARHVVLALPYVDLRAEADESQQARLRAVQADVAGASFDLGHGPLLRACLVQLRDDVHVLLVTAHHIICDGWSVPIFLDDLMTAYAAGGADALPPLPVQSAEFADWQRRWMASDEAAAQLAFWTETLRGTPPMIGVPVDRARTAVQTFRGGTVSRRLSASVRRMLRAVGHRANATEYMTLLAAFQVLLHRYSGDEDIWVGTPIANRTRAAWGGVVGFFANTLVMRTAIAGELTFSDVLGRVRATATAAYAHQELPFETVVQALQPARDLSRTPLFQVMFTFEEDVVSAPREVAGVRVTPEALDNSTAKFDLTLFMRADADGLEARLEYNAALFEVTTAARMLGHLETLLASISAAADAPIATLTLLSEEERREVVETWNATDRGYAVDRCVHAWIEAQAAARPDAVAVVSDGETLRYADLNARANQLAWYLRAHGVGPDVRVAICLARTPALIVAALGVLKAGGAYVPLDAEYPADRLQYMLADMGGALVLTDAQLEGRLAGVAGVRVVCLDRDWPEIARRSDANPPVHTAVDHLAYVIYTSGSTGQPKGVMVSHRNLMNLVRWHIDAFAIGPQDRGSCVAGLGFDASVWEVWPYLVAGASLAIPHDDERRDPEQLQRWLRDAGVTVTFIPTPLAEELLHREWPATGALRTLLTGGDRLRQRASARVPWRLNNNYGPTEATVVATSGWVTAVEADTTHAVPSIGRPIANTRTYVLDRALQPVARGMAGELYIGGAGVARGYLNRPALTAERFVPDPFGGDAGARLYRTGDVVRHRADGELDFLGRNDNQTKIRGFRIELGEIEAVLQQLPAVRNAVVIVQSEESGEKQLVAYVAADGEPAQTELRDLLRQKLPEYMVPSAYVFLDELPLTVNGKVDRDKLPRAEPMSQDVAYVAPRTPLEQRMADIWKELLQVERVGIHDNFFDLGGHSLQASKAIVRMREALHVPMAVSELFHHPTIERLAQQLQRDGDTVPASSEPPLVAQPREVQPQSGEFAGCAVLPASPGQQRLWFLHALDARSGAAYHVCGGLKLDGLIEPSLMAESVNRVVARHESLRTRLAVVDGELRQIIMPQLRLEMAYEDVRDSGGDERIKAITADLAERPFDLARDPLLRASLVRTAGAVFQLMIAAHHIICDGWSVKVFIRDLMEEYRALVDGDRATLEPLQVQYADFAAWQYRWLASDEAIREMEYWTTKLQGPAPLLTLPVRGSRPVMQSFCGATEALTVPRAVGDRLRAQGRATGATTFMTLLSAFTVLLHKYTGQRDIWIGTPVANRPRLELEPVIGFFANTLVLRTEVDPALTFADVLARVRETVTGAFGHQQLPFEKLVETFHPQRRLSTSPLFQVMFLIEEPLDMTMEPSGVHMTSIVAETGTAKFDLTLSMAERAEGLVARIEYNRDLFDAGTIRRMLGHFGVLLQEMAAAPERHLWELSPLSEQDKRHIVRDWNATEADYPPRCLHELVDEQALRTPDRVAVAWQGRHLTYGALNRRANQLANYLRQRGVGPDVGVAICMQRGLDMIAALLGVLKAGGAYVPLDPAYPQERLEWMLDDAQAAVLLTDARSQAPRSGSGVPSICLDLSWEEIERQPDTAPVTGTDPMNLAYLIYTSGSTGRPKGVAITHHSAALMVQWAREVFTDNELAGVLASTSICFDLSVFEVFVPLSWGGTVLLAANALDLVRIPERTQVTLINTVPSAIAELLRLEAIPSSVRTVNLAGEALPRSLVERVYELDHVERVFNLYGPSEDTTYSTYEWVNAGAAAEAVSIGRPITNTRVYVLDAALQAVPVGVVGELYIGGEGQARGYVNRPDITAERFVPDPHSLEPGERMYRTGDLARWKVDGSLEFLGRLDHQVKIRGYRIEMGELESALLQQPRIQHAVAAVHGMGAEQRLVAYVVAQDGAADLNVGALRDRLRSKLPAYMLPDVIVPLAELPLTSNGKVDRKKLPEPGRDRGSGAEYVRPRSAEEEIMCGIFAEVLELESVGIEDDFFDMGGHSLLVTQVVSRIRNTLAVELPLSDVFEAPTAAGMAERVKAARGASRSGPPPLVAIARDGMVPLSYGQHRLWFIDQLQPGNPAYNIAFGLRLTGALDRAALRWSLEEIVRRHESLRTSFPLRDGNPVQAVAASSRVSLEEVDLRHEAPDDRDTLVMARARTEARWSFDLSSGPLLRLTLVQLDEQDLVLLVTMHHIISDGWSLGVLTRELIQLYQARLKLEEPRLRPLKVQYADYAAWQRAWLREGTLDTELSYWRKQLADLPVLELPADHPRPAVMTYRGGAIDVRVSEELTNRLKQFSRQHDVTLFMCVLAAFQTVLGRWAGQDDVAVGTGIANRNQHETEGLIGFFVNTLVLRTRLNGNPTFIELLKRVRSVTLDAYQHQNIPFEKLVDELQPARDLSRTPLFQAMLMFQNLGMPELQLPGLRVSEFPVETAAAKVDLMLTLQESDGTLSGELSYARDLYEPDTMGRLAAHVTEVLERMVAQPDAAIGEVSLLTGAERRQIVNEWNATTREYPRDRQLHELIEAQVERSPDAEALACDGTRLSYRELNERANQLGSYLREHGVRADVRVGICAERSIEMVVGLLGILKAGGAYVPLEPDYPAERLAYMLADTQPAVLLTQERLQARLAALTSVRTVCLDRDWPAIAERPVNLPRDGSLDNLAYVIYTSGSTGQPKGAMIPNHGIVNRLLWMQEQYQLTGDDRVLQKTPFTFDVSVWEFFWPLMTGAGLVICKPGRHGDSRYLVDLIERERVTTLHFVPSMLNQFLEEPELYKCGSVRQVMCSGEALPAAVQARFFDRMTAKLHNLYGPTEASVDVTYWTCLPQERDRVVPIGRPIANTQIYVLDEHLNPVPVGVKGDLYIGGVGLGRGYQNRPGLTAEKFVPDSLGALPGQRLYKTGDLARFRADGRIEFLGRSDFQVKVRGFRIELGEIEEALQRHHAIKDAVVVARAGTDGDQRLVAYVVAAGERSPGIEELRSYLQDRLPSYMVPAQFIALPEMPLSKNGKADRRALPDPGTYRPQIETRYVEPATVEEQVFAQVWRQVLGIERVGVDDNFFALGGDSIRSLQVITSARAQGLQLTLQQLFQTPTIRGVAAHARWCADPTARAEQPRAFDLVAAHDRAKLQARRSRPVSVA